MILLKPTAIFLLQQNFVIMYSAGLYKLVHYRYIQGMLYPIPPNTVAHHTELYSVVYYSLVCYNEVLLYTVYFTRIKHTFDLYVKSKNEHFKFTLQPQETA